LTGTWPSLLNVTVNIFAVWRKQSSKNIIHNIELFGSLKNPHGLIHQPNTSCYNPEFQTGSLRKTIRYLKQDIW
jgi:hypothetical protein